MRRDPHLATIFYQLAAGTEIGYLLHVDVLNARSPDEHAIRVRVARLIFNAHALEFDLSPFVEGAFTMRWVMPDAAPTCNLFYAENVDALLTAPAVKAHVGYMLAHVEDEIRRLFPEYGDEWRIDFFVSKVCK